MHAEQQLERTPDWRDLMEPLLEFANYIPNQPTPDQLNSVFRDILRSAIGRGDPIDLVLPAFPAKSSNRQKTFSSLPDLGEVLALQRLNTLCERLGKIHAPGARIIICSDGRVFSDLVGVSEHDVSQYAEQLKLITKRHRLSHIHFFDLEDVFVSETHYQGMRCALEERYGETIDSLRARVKADASTQGLFNGIHRFIKEDYFFLYPKLSRNRVSRLSKEVAYQVIRRSNAWGALVQEHFPQALRLSIHPQSVDSPKFPIRLMEGADQWGTPWHRVPLFDGMEYQLVRHSEARAVQASLKRTPEGYVYFEGAPP